VSGTASIRTARKGRVCSTHECYVGCRGWIEAGERYRRAVLFPGDINSDTVPWVLNECEACAEYHGRWNAVDLYDQFAGDPS